MKKFISSAMALLIVFMVVFGLNPSGFADSTQPGLQVHFIDELPPHTRDFSRE